MRKYICEGATIQRKNDITRQGVVVSLDRKAGIVIAQQSNAFWSDKIKNVEVISYKEVR